MSMQRNRLDFKGKDSGLFSNAEKKPLTRSHELLTVDAKQYSDQEEFFNSFKAKVLPNLESVESAVQKWGATYVVDSKKSQLFTFNSSYQQEQEIEVLLDGRQTKIKKVIRAK